MPILQEETSLYPETLLDETFEEPSQRKWWALYTKPRQEKAVSRALLGYHVPFYMPLVKKISKPKGRRIVSHVPLFAGYMFLYGTEEERVQGLTTNRILQCLPVDDEPLLVRDLRQFRKLIAAEAPLTVEARLVAGNRVRVRHGTFAGLEGTVLKRRSKTHLLVAVNFLQQGASVEIDDYMLEPID